MIFPSSNAFSIVAGKKFKNKNIGILALQGDVRLHVEALKQLRVSTSLIKMPYQLKGLDGLVIPGGESSSLLKLAEPIGMLPAITRFAQTGGAILGTCAGAIILASKVTNPAQDSLGLIDITVERNGYGRQIDSSEVVGQALPPLIATKLPMTFIRAPCIKKVGAKVKVLATFHNEPVLVQQEKIMAATFHPELNENMVVYNYWLSL